MRIAIFTELYAPSVGGQEAFFAGLGGALLRRGNVIDVYCIGHEAGLPAFEEIEGVRVHRCPIEPHYKQPHTPAARRNWAAIVRYAWYVRAVAQKQKHDVFVLNQWPLLHAFTLPMAARRRALVHWCEIRHSSFYQFVQAWIPRLVRLNGAISDSVGAQIKAASGQDVMTLPSGLDLSKSIQRARSERRDIIVLGRVTAHKNLPFMIEAFEILKAGGYPGRLRIAGDGPDMPAVRAKIAASSVASDIDLLGFISDEQKWDLLSRAEVLAMPSKREGFPHVTSEAMSCGLPIATMEYPENGTKDVVRTFDSGLVTESNPAAFAAGISRVTAHWELYSENGLAAARSLDWGAIAERLEGELEAAVSKVDTLRPVAARPRSSTQPA